MRRVVPWALLGLVIVAGAVGAGLGLSSVSTITPGGPKLSEVIAATRAAGTARFTFSSVGSSPDPEHRSISIGKGVVDFRSNSMTTDQRNLSTGSSERDGAGPQAGSTTMLDDQTWIGRTFFARLGLEGEYASSPWVEGHFPRGSYGSLGVLDEVDPVGSFENDIGVHGTKVQSTGTALVRKESATTYRVTLPACATKNTSMGFRDAIGPVDLWVDDQGRLIQVRNVVRVTSTTGSDPGLTTITSTIRLFDFGVPATIEAPKVLPAHGQSAIAFLTLSPKSCR